MKTYKEYYQFGLKKFLEWEGKQKEEWWKKNSLDSFLDMDGEYLEGVRTLDREKKNDAGIILNLTNIRNSEWNILFTMLGQALVDWCVEHKRTNKLHSFRVTITKIIDENFQEVYVPEFVLEKSDGQGDGRVIEEEKTPGFLKEFENCAGGLCDLVMEFIDRHKKNIPIDWNFFLFGLDNLSVSCLFKEWVAASDGYMCLGNLDEDTDSYKMFLECM